MHIEKSQSPAVQKRPGRKPGKRHLTYTDDKNLAKQRQAQQAEEQEPTQEPAQTQSPLNSEYYSLKATQNNSGNSSPLTTKVRRKHNTYNESISSCSNILKKVTDDPEPSADPLLTSHQAIKKARSQLQKSPVIQSGAKDEDAYQLSSQNSKSPPKGKEQASSARVLPQVSPRKLIHPFKVHAPEGTEPAADGRGDARLAAHMRSDAKLAAERLGDSKLAADRPQKTIKLWQNFSQAPSQLNQCGSGAIKVGIRMTRTEERKLTPSDSEEEVKGGVSLEGLSVDEFLMEVKVFHINIKSQLPGSEQLLSFGVKGTLRQASLVLTDFCKYILDLLCKGKGSFLSYASNRIFLSKALVKQICLQYCQILRRLGMKQPAAEQFYRLFCREAQVHLIPASLEQEINEKSEL